MKLKILMMLGVLFFSSRVFAISTFPDFPVEGYSHSSGVKDGGFITTKDEIKDLSADDSHKNNLNNLVVKAYAYNSKGKVGSDIKVKGVHRYCVTNYADRNVMAAYVFKLKAYGEDVHNVRVFQAMAHQARCIEQQSYMVITTRSMGHYPVNALTHGYADGTTEEDRDAADMFVTKE